MTASDIPIRVGDPGDWDAIWNLLGQVFHDSPSAEASAVDQAVFEPARSLVLEDDGAIVGHGAAYTRDLTVPGAVLPAAHVTLVGVAPTHRRRGLLTRMMHRQLREIAAAGREPIAVLWASESKIYQRFGYGHAAHRLRLDVPTPEVHLPDTPTRGRLRAVDTDAGRKDFATVYEHLRPHRVGWSSRDEAWWSYTLADVEAHRHGATPLQAVVYGTPDGPAGYALWRTKGDWNERGADGRVEVREVAAADPDACLALWRFLFSIDLTRHVSVHHAALDEPLQYLVDDARRLGASIGDGLWIRVVDLPAALAGRRYAAPLDVVLDVTDPLLEANTGRWRLTVDDTGTATCTPTSSPADLSCTVLELGTVYLGAVRLAALAAAGKVTEHTPGALRRATASFGWHRMPQPVEVF
ncbi:GNAT family N-acetyltransferase [Actinoplanes sp. N902-109]|uniref:GNAT family N-acetyltransferase n=1 Tax=Actinoplanes sp. (strain N902-109) TaxID=649831 RepID=UPI0003294A56|nr:GNAT family N-acetyltransferase [Actinoplanes sp. N902-109]AGL14971.1 GCN5-like N-acetyltransferase [Actinoplanes sp. N902-109]